MRTVFVVAALALAPIALCSAQSNDVLDELLDQDPARFAHTAYVVLAAAEMIDENVSVSEAYQAYQALGWRLSAKSAEEPVSAGELSYMIMKSLDLRGGVMYSILPSPRYAYRELVYDGFLPARLSKQREVSGEQVLRYLGAVMRAGEVAQ